MAYTPYAQSGDCKTADEVNSDVASIKQKGFTTIRLYATDCSGPQNVGAAAKANGLKLILGIFINNSGIGDNTNEQISTLTEWGQGQWDLVEMVVFGNEALFNEYTSPSALVDGISDCKSKFRAAGYNGPVTTTDTVSEIQQNAEAICGVVDVIAANIHPFFNGQTIASNAGDFVSSQLGDLASSCNNQKDAYNLETGWPSQGDAFGLAIPGLNDQKTAISSIISSAGSKSVMFSFENDLWKAPGNLDVEQYWGCADLFSG
jgi:exo-beta-1,3-glucanase (GH17 family)